MINWPVWSYAGIFSVVIACAALLPHMRLIGVEIPATAGRKAVTMRLYGNGEWAIDNAANSRIRIYPTCTSTPAVADFTVGGPYYVSCISIRPITATLQAVSLLAAVLHLIPGYTFDARSVAGIKLMLILCGVTCGILFLAVSVISLAAVSASLSGANISPGAQIVEWIGLAASIGTVLLVCSPVPRRSCNTQSIGEHSLLITTP